MRYLALSLSGFLLAACQGEYEIIHATDGPPPVANPRPLEGAERVDRVRQVGVPKVDVLWIIDNSCSMWEEQTALAENFPSFMQFFLGSGLDYHIGVVSTDMEDLAHQGRLRQVDGHRFIDQTTPNPHGVFASMVQMGTTGYWDEKGFEAAFSAVEVEGEGFNAGFVRERAALHQIVISDENDYSAWSAPEFAAWLSGTKPSAGYVSFSSIVGLQTECPEAAEPGTDYLDVSDRLGGVKWPICSGEWGRVLELLGLQATARTNEFFLSAIPVEESIRVSVELDGVSYVYERDVDWVYSATRNSVTFLEYLPEPLAEIVIRYDVGEF